MTAKEYLLQARSLDRRIDRMLEEVTRLKAKATSTTKALSGMPEKPGASDQVGDYVAAYLRLEQKINAVTDELVDRKSEILDVIRAIGNSQYEELLELRYIGGCDWNAIAERMGYSLRQIYREHGHALLAVSVPQKDGTKWQ